MVAPYGDGVVAPYGDGDGVPYGEGIAGLVLPAAATPAGFAGVPTLPGVATGVVWVLDSNGLLFDQGIVQWPSL